MRISDWSSDVCSSDLDAMAVHAEPALHVEREFELAEFIAIGGDDQRALGAIADGDAGRGLDLGGELRPDRKSVVSGKSVSVRVDLGGRRIIKKKKTTSIQTNIYKTIKKNKIR